MQQPLRGGVSTRMKTRMFAFALAGCVVSTSGGCDDAQAPDNEVERGALLFDLTEADVVEIHDRYLSNEPLEVTRAKFSAPFDCEYYADLCEFVGRQRVIDITQAQVDMALDGATMAEIDVALEVMLDVAEQEWLAEDAANDLAFRSSSAWSIDRNGNDRIKVRNGIINPAMSSVRQAWTQTVAQERGGSALPWHSSNNYDDVCTNTGTNTQRLMGLDILGQPVDTSPYESVNPGQTCTSSKHSWTHRTNHARNNGQCYGIGAEQGNCHSHVLRANGCGNADFGTFTLSACASQHQRIF